MGPILRRSPQSISLRARRRFIRSGWRLCTGSLRQDWATTYARCRQLASALQKAGVGQGDTVAVMLPNIPAMVEVHFGVPMSGAVLNTLNTRLEPESLAFMLDYAQAKVLLVDREFVGVISKALALCQVKTVVDRRYRSGIRDCRRSAG
jgi:acyl-CoA synthetase (AMP-forming)/AMP-acid ligase II